MLRRWVESGIDAARFTVIDPGTPQLPEGVRHVAEPPEGLPQAMMLGVKPQLIDKVAPLYAGRGQVPILLSILAGVEEAALAKRFDARTVVRVMPNLPVALGKGVVALYTSGGEAADRDATGALMDPLGQVEWIESEDLFHVVTALAGSGPGYVYRFIAALGAGAAELGLPHDQALRFATAMVEGAAALAGDADATPGELADRVASPGGTTRAGMDVLDEGDALKRLMRATLEAAATRSEDLAGAARG